MRVINETLLATFRRSPLCEWCKRKLRHPAHPHHLRARGMGGGGRLDVRINLVALGSHRDCNCHGSFHDGNPPLRCDLLAVIATREGMLQDDVERLLDRMLRAPKLAEVCPRCEGTGRIRQLGDVCLKCGGGAVLLLGLPWVEQERKPTWRVG